MERKFLFVQFCILQIKFIHFVSEVNSVVKGVTIAIWNNDSNEFMGRVTIPIETIPGNKMQVTMNSL